MLISLKTFYFKNSNFVSLSGDELEYKVHCRCTEGPGAYWPCRPSEVRRQSLRCLRNQNEELTKLPNYYIVLSPFEGHPRRSPWLIFRVNRHFYLRVIADPQKSGQVSFMIGFATKVVLRAFPEDERNTNTRAGNALST